MRKRWITAAAVLALVVTPLGFYVLRGPQAQTVETARVEPRAIAPSILASGTLVYESQVTLVSEVMGRVDEVLVQEGDRVTRGQVLLRLDARTPRAEIEQAQASEEQSRMSVERQRINLEALQAKTRRYEELRRQGLVEAVRYDELVAERNVAEVDLRNSREAVRQTAAQLTQSRQRLAKTEIRAPMSGRVTQISIKPGETAVPSAMSIAGGSLMVIADTSSMFAEVNVDEADIARVGVGQAAQIVPAAYPDRSLHGTVDRIAVSPRQNAGQGRTYPVRIRLDAQQAATFRPGMSARAEIATVRGPAKHLSVPVQAVQYAEARPGEAAGATSVFVLAAGKASRREVQPGVADDSHIEILKGLSEGETVVSGPAKVLRLLRDGDPVRVATPAATPAAASQPAELPADVARP